MCALTVLLSQTNNWRLLCPKISWCCVPEFVPNFRPPAALWKTTSVIYTFMIRPTKRHLRSYDQPNQITDGPPCNTISSAKTYWNVFNCEWQLNSKSNNWRGQVWDTAVPLWLRSLLNNIMIFARRAYCVGGSQKSVCVRPSVRPSVCVCVRTWRGRRKWSYQVQIVNLGFQKYHFWPVFENLMDLGGQRVIHVHWRSWRILENFKLFLWTFPFGRPCPAGPI